MNIKVSSLTKVFGDKKILDSININFNSGNMYCLLGRNGVGKTTFLHILLQSIDFDSGNVFYDDIEYKYIPTTLKQRIGFAGDNHFLIDELTAVQYLKFISKLYNLNPTEVDNRCKELLNYFFEDVEILNKKQISALSTGTKKIIGICAAILHTPDCLILDEPFAGLDPIASNQVIKLLHDYQTPARTVLISSHDMDYVEKLQTNIILLNDGKIMFEGTNEDVKQIDTSLDKLVIEILKPKITQKISWL